MKFGQVKASPGDYYSSPKELIADPQWSKQQLCEILQNWKQYLTQLSVATEENMAGAHQGEADLLAQIGDTLNEIGPANASMEATPGPAKTG